MKSIRVWAHITPIEDVAEAGQSAETVGEKRSASSCAQSRAEWDSPDLEDIWLIFSIGEVYISITLSWCAARI